jgi:hypothetical protein
MGFNVISNPQLNFCAQCVDNSCKIECHPDPPIGGEGSLLRYIDDTELKKFINK